MRKRQVILRLMAGVEVDDKLAREAFIDQKKKWNAGRKAEAEKAGILAAQYTDRSDRRHRLAKKIAASEQEEYSWIQLCRENKLNRIRGLN